MDRRKKPTFQQLELSTLLESMPEAVFILDVHGNVVEVNHAARELFLRSSGTEDPRGWNHMQLARRLAAQPEGKSVAGPELVMNRALRGEVVRHVLIGAEDGAPQDLLISACPMRNKDGVVVGALVVVQDVSEIYRLQRRLADTERHLAIGQMAADIAHDLNNALSAIEQAAAMLQIRPDLKESDRKLYLHVIRNSGRRGVEIIQRLRDYIRGGKGELKPTDICSVLREALEFAGPRLSDKIQVKTEWKALPPVLGNTADLRRSFANLILNAIDAMPNGGRLTVGCYGNHEKVIAFVEDTGVGIAPEDNRKIFAPYYTTKPKGTGLGLISAQKIVQRHGGSVRFRSELNRGTRFIVELPMLKTEPRAA